MSHLLDMYIKVVALVTMVRLLTVGIEHTVGAGIHRTSAVE